jgi:hypothetical protein
MNMMTTTGKNKHAERNSRWRAKINAEVNSITTELNAKRAELGLPPVSWTFEHSCTFKGRKRPVYLPPKELRASMTEQQVSQWQCEERKKRKALKQRENRMRKKAMLDQMKAELVELNRRVEEMKKREIDTLPSDINKAESTLSGTSDDAVMAPIQGVQQVKNSAPKEELLVADPYIEDDVDAASWSDDDEILASADEIAKVFDVDVATAPIQGITEEGKNSGPKEEFPVANLYIENDVYTALWSDGDESLASVDEIAKLFDVWSKY